MQDGDEYKPIRRSKEESDEQDEYFGFEDFKEGEEKLGWMVTYSQVPRLPFPVLARTIAALCSWDDFILE